MSKKIAILGAGISGLTCAWEIKKKFPEAALTLFEKNSRPGGWIKTAYHLDSLFEWGPRSLRLQDADAALLLIAEMGLSNELIAASSHARNRYILHQGKLVQLPTSFWELFLCPLTRKCLHTVLKDLVTPNIAQSDISIYEFFSHRFSRKVADYFIDPLLKGIFAGDAKELSMRACFPKIWALPRSVILGSLSFKKKKKGLVTLKRGMETLIFALANRLQNEIRLNAEIESFDDFDQVISTLPAHALAKILPKSQLQELLEKIPFRSLGVVHLGYSHQLNGNNGFGYLIPSKENDQVLGVIFDSSIFPEQGKGTRLTVMIGENGNLKKMAKEHVKKVLGIHVEPTIIESLWMSNAIPQYPVGFIDELKKIHQAKEAFPNLVLQGTSFYGISMNQAIQSAKNIMERIYSYQRREKMSVKYEI